eukprot:1201246-Rhodomonas_salina.2
MCIRDRLRYVQAALGFKFPPLYHYETALGFPKRPLCISLSGSARRLADSTPGCPGQLREREGKSRGVGEVGEEGVGRTVDEGKDDGEEGGGRREDGSVEERGGERRRERKRAPA